MSGKSLLNLVFLFVTCFSWSQIGINTTDPQSTLDIKGALILSNANDVQSKTSLIYKKEYSNYSFGFSNKTNTNALPSQEYDRVLLTSSSTSDSRIYSLPINKFIDYSAVEPVLSRGLYIENIEEDSENKSIIQFNNVEFRAVYTKRILPDLLDIQWRPRSNDCFASVLSTQEFRGILKRYGMLVGGPFSNEYISVTIPSGRGSYESSIFKGGDDWISFYKGSGPQANKLYGTINFQIFGMTPFANSREEYYEISYAILNHPEPRKLIFTVKQIDYYKEVFDETGSDALWLSGMFSGIYGTQYKPKGFEVYINDLNLDWETAKYFQFRIGNGPKQFLFPNEADFINIKAGFTNSNNQNHRFVYFYDNSGFFGPSDAFGTLFPSADYGWLNKLNKTIYNTSPNGSDKGNHSVILYYKDLVVDAFGDLGPDGLAGTGKFAPDRWEGWAKRKPGTRPQPLDLENEEFGLFVLDDWWVAPQAFRPDDSAFVPAKKNGDVDYPFPLGSNSSTKNRGTFTIPNNVQGYTYP